MRVEDAGNGTAGSVSSPSVEQPASSPVTPRADTDPVLPEVARYWPSLLRGAAGIMDPHEPLSLFDLLPSKMKQADWVEFAIAAAFLVADLAHELGRTAADLNAKAAELRARATQEQTPS